MKRRLILASASPRRIEMFRKNGIEAEICPSNLQERLPEGISPEQTVLYLSLGKALDVERRFLEKNPLPEERVFILGADTVVFTNRILGKPKDEEEAFEMLKSLCGGEHRVLTGVSIVEAGTVNRKSFLNPLRCGRKATAMRIYAGILQPVNLWTKREHTPFREVFPRTSTGLTEIMIM